MPSNRILLIENPGADRRLRALLGQITAPLSLAVSRFSDARSAIDSEPELRKASALPVLVILAPDLARPEQQARQLHSSWPQAHFLFVVRGRTAALEARLMSPVSGVGSHWEIVDLTAPAAERQILQVLQASVSQCRFRTTLSRLQSGFGNNDKPPVSELQRLSVSIPFLSHIVDHAHQSIIATTLAGAVVRWNLAASRLFQRDADQVIGHPVFNLLEPDWREPLDSAYRALNAGLADFLELELGLLQDKGRLFLALTLSLIRDHQGRAIGVTLFVRDITERKLTEAVLENMRKDLERMSFEDGLTGIANRRSFDQALAREWQRAQRHQRCLSVVLLDIDHFKDYNDCYGHPQGDACLKQVAQLLRHCIGRPADLVARYGGEEFVLLLPETDQSAALALAHKCRDAVSDAAIAHARSDTAPVVSLSAGLASTAPNTQTGAPDIQAGAPDIQVGAPLSPEALLAEADRQLYRAKAAGRNCVMWAQ